MNNLADGITAEAKANMLTNLQIEIDSRTEKLRAQCDAQCASMQSRLERRVNRIPVVTRQTTLLQLLKVSAPAPPVVVAAPPAKPAPTKKATATATRKARTAAPTNAATGSSSRPASSLEERVKPVAKATKPTPAYAKATKNTRAKKRSSDEMSGEDKAGEDKENTDLPVPKKRTRTIARKPSAPTATVRSTRAASRTKPAAAAHVLSPKTNAANVRKPAARSARPR